MELTKELVGAALSARQTAKIKLRQPISRIIIVTDDPTVKRAVDKLDQIIFSQANTRKIEFMNVDEEEKFKELKAIPNYKTLGPIFKKEANIVAELIKKLDGRKVFVEIKDKGSYDLEFEGKYYTLNSEMITLREEMAENFVPGVFSKGRVYVDVTMPKKLITEGLARDVVRRMQEMRRQMNLPVDAYVNAYLISPREIEKSLIKRKDYIIEEVRIKKLNFIRERSKKTHIDLWREWLIGGSSYFMGLQRIVKKKSNSSKRSNRRTKRRS
jgi:isoleucyl-tRNA synthetase